MVALALIKGGQVDTPGGAALVKGDARLFFLFVAWEQAVIAGAHALPGGGDFVPWRQRFGRRTAAGCRGGLPAGTALSLLACLEPAAELQGPGPGPAFGARRGLGRRASANAEDRDVDV